MTSPTPQPQTEAERLAARMMEMHVWHSDGQPTSFSEAADLILAQAAELAQARAERDNLRARLDRAIGAAQEHFGEDCIRYKLSLFGNGRARNVFPAGMDGKWFAFQRADNDAHIGLCDTIATLRAELEGLKAQGQPLSDSAVMNEFCRTPGIHQFVTAFKAGVRYAERAHKIGGANADQA